MLKRISDFFAGVKMTAVSGVCLAASLVMLLADVNPILDPAWITVVLSGYPLLYLALTRLFFEKWISSALLISMAMVASLSIGELFAAGEVAFIMAIGAILEDILAPGQYETNVATRRDSRNPVEFAVVLPGDGETPVYLPIDAKFPADAYIQLTQAYDLGDREAIDEAARLLKTRVKAFARDIRDKYIDPPHTTDFAVMFLPFEGLYAQVLQLDLVEQLQRDYKVVVAGPTTMAALLNSLQMGFKTLAIQKRSAEVWQVLGAVKTEFNRFGDVLETTQQRLEQAGSELDKLVGVRTRAIRRRLAQVGELPETDAAALLGGDE